MSCSIAAATTGGGGLISTADATGSLDIKSGTTTIVAMTSAGIAVTGTLSSTTGVNLATSSGSVGIGTASPGQKLEISNTSSSGFAAIRMAADSRSYDVGVGGSTSGFQQNNWYIYDGTAAATRMVVDSSGNLQFNSGYGSAATAYGCRAWGLSTWSGGVPTLAASGGVSSITDAGTGNMTWNLSITLPDTNYSVFGSVGTDCIWCRVSKNSKTTTAVSFGFANPANTAEVDPTTPVSMAIFR